MIMSSLIYLQTLPEAAHNNLMKKYMPNKVSNVLQIDQLYIDEWRGRGLINLVNYVIMYSLHFCSLVHHFGIFGGVTILNLNWIATNLNVKRYE